MPQYTVGHDERMEVMKQQLHTDFPNVKLVGSSYDGISVPDCVTQGKSIADELLKEMFELQYA